MLQVLPPTCVPVSPFCTFWFVQFFGFIMPRRGVVARRRRGRRMRRRGFSLVREPGLITADAQMVRLRYLAEYPFIGAGLGTAVFRGNSLFDPEFALSGNQPCGFDEWSSLYGRYIVYACEIKLTFINEGTTGISAVLVPSLDSTTLTSPFRGKELPYAKAIYIPSVPQGKSYVMSSSMTTARVWGDNVLNESSFGAVTSTNPSKAWYWQVVLDSIPAGNSKALTVFVEMNFIAKMHARLTIAGS